VARSTDGASAAEATEPIAPPTALMALVCDTGPLLAALDVADPAHVDALHLLA
jgi:hypothetical protein